MLLPPAPPHLFPSPQSTQICMEKLDFPTPAGPQTEVISLRAIPPLSRSSTGLMKVNILPGFEARISDAENPGSRKHPGSVVSGDSKSESWEIFSSMTFYVLMQRCWIIFVVCVSVLSTIFNASHSPPPCSTHTHLYAINRFYQRAPHHTLSFVIFKHIFHKNETI